MSRPNSERKNYTPFSTVISQSGLAAALSGILFALWGYVDREGAPWYLDLGVIVLGIVVPLLFMVGLAGVYAKCRAQVGWPGVIGFVVAFGAAGWGIVTGVISAPTMYAWLGESSSEQCTALECGLPLLLSSSLTWLLVGLSVVGLSTVRKGRLRYWAHLLLAMALFGWIYQLTDDKTGIVDVRTVHVAFGVLFSLSWVMLGYALWSSKTKASPTSKEVF